MKYVLVKKIAMDQVIFAPFAVGSITSMTAYLDGKNAKEIQQKLQTDFFSILMANYKVRIQNFNNLHNPSPKFKF